eukprot:CAMPEP_0171311144 /NCGR_PEP_ID=MMETSP0816-20121228/21371_1 /TAXON_ID=420281 /ORGANISM="Proboscia inermis, Strain CCAP1064/1" /LENGTH=172 /DNA_ID=CAMNT_0011795719 /DNA_START=717 /DNA_END=1233 /DNA_ORIENTATION=-
MKLNAFKILPEIVTDTSDPGLWNSSVNRFLVPAHLRKITPPPESISQPQLGLNESTRFANCATGNQPGLMPLDAHLNQDLHSQTDYHVLLSNSLPDDDKRKISKRTPKKCAEAYKRIWDSSLGPDAEAPTSKRIKKDIDRVVDGTYLKIFNARGCVIETGNTGRRSVKRDGA